MLDTLMHQNSDFYSPGFLSQNWVFVVQLLTIHIGGVVLPLRDETSTSSRAKAVVSSSIWPKKTC